MARVAEKAVDSEVFGIENASQEVFEKNFQIFDDTTSIINLESKPDTRKTLKIELNLDQIEDSE